jgi:hypothetical protein
MSGGKFTGMSDRPGLTWRRVASQMQTDRGLATGILVAWLIVSTIAVVILLVLRHDPWPSALSAVVGTGLAGRSWHTTSEDAESATLARRLTDPNTDCGMSGHSLMSGADSPM